MRSNRFFRVFRTVMLVLLAAALLPAAVSGAEPVIEEPVTEPLTVTVFLGNSGSQPAADNRIYQLIEQQLGIRFEFEFLEGNLDETIGLLAQNPYPNLIDGGNSADALEYAGALIDMLPYITEEGTPNLYQHVYTDDRLSKMTCDGKLYIIPNYGIYDNDPVSNDFNGSSFFIQKQVVAWNNYVVPTTLNEYFDLIERYVAAHPEENYTGFEMLSEDWRTWALLNPVQHLMGRPNDGDVLVDVSTPEYKTETFINQDYAKAYYAKLNEEYNKGIISADTFDLDYDTYLASLAGGKVLGTFDQKWNMGAVAGMLEDGESYLAIPLVYDPEYVNGKVIEEHYQNGTVMNRDRGFGISVSCDNPERMVQLFDTLLSDEWQTILQWGIAGEDYTVDENGRMVMTAEQYSNLNNPEWRLANMADAIFQSSPKKQGTMDNGNAWDPNTQPEIYAGNLSEYDRAFYEACGKQTSGEFFNPPIELAPYGEAWQIDKSPISDDYFEFQGIELTYLPEIITCDPDELDAKWEAFVEEITPSAEIVTEYMQEAILAAAGGGGGNDNRCGEALSWTYDEYGTVTVSGTGTMYDFADPADVPWADVAYDIGTVVIEEGVTSIGSNAFSGCSWLYGVSIAYGVTSIGDQALNGCERLFAADMPQSVTEIGAGAFQGCGSLSGMTVPKNVARLRSDVFGDCTSLASVSIPVSVTEIEACAFRDCGNLVDVYYAGTETQWNEIVIDQDGNQDLLAAAVHFSALPVELSGDCGAEDGNLQWTLDVYDTLTISGAGAMADYGGGNQVPWVWYTGTMNEVRIADGITRIGSRAFSDMTWIKEIEIPATVTSIGESAFEGWTSLKTVYYGGTQDEWAAVNISEAGNGQLSAAQVYCLGPHDHQAVTDPAVAPTTHECGLTEGSHCSVCGLVLVPQETIQPVAAVANGECGNNMVWGLSEDGTLFITGTGKMDNYSWDFPAEWHGYSADIRKAVIGKGVQSIGSWAFESCDCLEEAVLNEGLTGIGEMAFAYCGNLGSVTLPSSLGKIGYGAFMSTGLETVSIPAGVRNIGESVFAYCSRLTAISVDPANSKYASVNGVLFNREKTRLIQYPVGKDGTTYIVPNGVTAIEQDAFSWAGLTSVELPDSMRTVGSGAFYYAQELRKIVFPAGSIRIDSFAFGSCQSLRTVVFPGRDVTVADYAFTECGSLSGVYYGGTEAECQASLSADGEGNDPLLQAAWHYGMTRLPASLERIEDEAFRDCDLSMVVIPSGCGGIGEYAFAGCTDLVYVSLPATVTDYPDNAFAGCHEDLVIVRAR